MVSFKVFLAIALGATGSLATPTGMLEKSAEQLEVRQGAAPPPKFAGTEAQRDSIQEVMRDASLVLDQVDGWKPDIADVLGDVDNLFEQVGVLAPSDAATVSNAQNLLVQLEALPPNANDLLSQLQSLLANNMQPNTTSDSPPGPPSLIPSAKPSPVMGGPQVTYTPRPTFTPADLPKREPNGQNPVPASVDCAGRVYTQTVINAALNAACQLWVNWQFSGGYPHNYFNHEGISFATGAGNPPYAEFPIITSNNGVWNSADRGPGPDRLIFDHACNYLGIITHTGAAAYNKFVPC